MTTIRVFQLVAAIGVLFPLGLKADPLTESSPSVIFDFTGFTGAGFSPTPAAGQLNSNHIIVTGLSDESTVGVLDFGGTRTSGDFARGTSSGGVTTGGVYAFDIGGGNTALGIQPGGSDWTPGTFVFRVTNGGLADILQIDIEFKIYVFNDQERANKVIWEDSLDNMVFSDFGDQVISTQMKANTPAWIPAAANEFIPVGFAPGLLGPGDSYFFRFTGDDVSGSDKRDEFAIDDVRFTATFAQQPQLVPEPAPIVLWFVLTFVCVAAALWRRRRVITIK